MHCFFGIFKARFENLTPSEPGITLHYPYTVYNKRQCLLLIHWILLSKLFWKTIFIIQLFQWFHNNRPRSSEYEIQILHFHSNLHSEKLEATDNSMQLKAKNPRKPLTLSTKTLLQYTVQTLFEQLALMQIQQCLFLLIYLDHLQSQQLFPLDQTGKTLPRVTRWRHKVTDYALKEQQHVWQTEHEAVDPSQGYHPILPLRFLQELWIPEGI